MSGQASVAFEQTQPVDVAEFANETPENIEADPRASFLEKHGRKLIAGHDGEAVTVEYAYYNCDPYRRLVDAIGEAALGASAPKLPEENNEEEVEEMETEEETGNKEDKTEPKAEAKEPEKISNNSQPEEDLAAKQEVPKAEQSQTSEPQKQEVTAASDIVAKTAALGYGASQISIVEGTAPIEIAQVHSQQSQPVESATVVEAQTTSRGSGDSLGSSASTPISAVVTGSPAAPTASAETNSRPKVVVEAAEPAEVGVAAAQETEELSVQLDETSQIDELYEISDPEIDAEREVEDMLDDSELTFQLPRGELWQPPAEFIELELQEERMSEDFILPTSKAPSFSVAEYVQDSPEVVTELSVPVEEVEQTILQVADRIEQMEVEETETAYQILDELVQKIAEVQSPVEDDSENLEATIETEELEEELKVLFIRLFDHVGVEYSLELIESCVKLALRGDISDLIVKIEQGDEENNVPLDKGTHEVIKQLLAAISSIKKSVKHAYQIGKSALQLYSQELAPLDLKRLPAYGMICY